MTGSRFPLLYPIDERFFDALGPAQAWLVGLFAADGCVRGDRLATISQSGEHGFRLLQHVQHMLGHRAPIRTWKQAHTITITSATMVDFLKRFHVVERKSHIYKYPESMPPDLAAPFLRGYIDGDGCVGVYDNGRGVKSLLVSYFGTTEFIQRSVIDIPSSVRVRASKKCPGMSEARANGRHAIRFGRWLWSDTSLPRHSKQDIYDRYMSVATPRYLRYEPLRDQAEHLFKLGLAPMQVAREIGLSCQTVWRWKEQYAASRHPRSG